MVDTKTARVPEGERYYIVGDVHGCARQLGDLLAHIREDSARGHYSKGHLVFVGDYTDRGPDSFGVLEKLAGDPVPGLTPHFLLGNHDARVLEILHYDIEVASWLQWGGAATLASYGLNPRELIVAESPEEAIRNGVREAMPDHHRRFFESLKLTQRAGDFLFVHAGIRPGVPLNRQDPEDLFWIREPFLSSEKNFGFVVVHGHTPVYEVDWRKNRVDIDTGACFGGTLTCLVLEGREKRLIQVT